MSWNGLGLYTIPPSFFPEVNGNLVDATRYNGVINDLASGLNNALTKDGQNSATGDLPMGGFRHTGAASALAAGHYLVFGQSGAVLTSLTVTTLTVQGVASATGGVVLGDAASDTLTITGTAVSIPNNLSFDSGVLFIDSANNRVGINLLTPGVGLDVGDSVRIRGNLVVDGLASIPGISGITVATASAATIAAWSYFRGF